MGHMGPLGEEGVSPPWAWCQGEGPIPPLAGAPPPLGGLVPHGGGEEDVTPLSLYKDGVHPPFSKTQQYLSLSFSYLERTPLVWSLHLVGSSPP